MDIKIRGTAFPIFNRENLYWEEWKSTTAFKKMQIFLVVDIQVNKK